MTFAIYQRHDDQPTRVLYSHLTEETAIEVVDRLNTTVSERGIPACVWYEQHHPKCVFVISKRTFLK